MERFFGGNPALVLLRLAILSLIVGVVLAALGFSPFELIDSLRRLVERIYDMGFAAVEKAFRYFLLGAVIVFPVWIVMRLLKSLGRTLAAIWWTQARATAKPRGSSGPSQAACRSPLCCQRRRSAARSGSGSRPTAQSAHRRPFFGPSSRARRKAVRLCARLASALSPSFLRMAFISTADGGVFRYSTTLGFSPRASMSFSVSRDFEQRGL